MGYKSHIRWFVKIVQDHTVCVHLELRIKKFTGICLNNYPFEQLSCPIKSHPA